MTGQRFEPSRRQGQGKPAQRPQSHEQPALPPDYLRRGYFDQEGNIYPELITTVAEEIARTLSQHAHPKMTSTQLRRFYNKARSIKDRLDSGTDFTGVVSKIRELERDAVYSVGREMAPELFKQFMERNIQVAERGRKEFENGFLQHFQSVVAYSKYVESQKH